MALGTVVAAGTRFWRCEHCRHTVSAAGDCRYDLVSVVVHHGGSVSSGHYVAYVKSGAGVWYLCDDAKVCTVKRDSVLKAQAYILLYARRQPRTWLLPGGAAAEPPARGGGDAASAPAGEGVTTRSQDGSAPVAAADADDGGGGGRRAAPQPRNGRVPTRMARNLSLTLSLIHI